MIRFEGRGRRVLLWSKDYKAIVRAMASRFVGSERRLKRNVSYGIKLN